MLIKKTRNRYEASTLTACFTLTVSLGRGNRASATKMAVKQRLRLKLRNEFDSQSGQTKDYKTWYSRPVAYAGF